MKRLLYILSFLLALHHCNIISAQTSLEENSIIRGALDEMFEDLDKTKIPTRLLLDYAVDLVDLSYYDGTMLTDSNYVNLQTFEDILRSIRSASVNKSTFRNINAAMESFRTPLVDNYVNVAFAFYKYNYIKANALTDGLIAYDSSAEKVSDAYQNGEWLNPYDEAVVFAFTPSSNVCTSGNITFKFSTNYLFNNQGFSQLYFDAGDGYGYRIVNPMSIVSVNYSSSGYKELKLKLYTTTGLALETHSTMYVVNVDVDIPTRADGGAIEPTDSIIRETVYNGVTVRAQMTYYTSSPDGAIRKPFILVEGFDPWILEYLINDIDDSLPVHLGFTNHVDFAKVFYNNTTLGSDYDLIYIDWENSLEDIRANAQLLIMLLEEINEMKASAGSTETNVVFGQSMGGLVARYALRTMENDNKPHQVSTYVSHDSPHLGANVPLGALYFIPQLLSMIHGYDQLINLGDLITGNVLTEAEQRFYSVLHSMAAKQMLVNYVTPSGIIDNSIHNEWQEELEQLGFPEGDFGQNIQKLTIVNGRAYNIDSTLIKNKHLLYLDGYAKSKFLLDFLAPILSFYTDYILQDILNFFDFSYLAHAFTFWGSSKLNLHAEVNPLLAVNAGQKISELKFWYTKKYLWLFPKTYNLFSSTKFAPNSGLFYDEYPGSYYPLEISEDGQPYYPPPFEGSLDYVGSYSFTVGITNKIMFIPTASALAITGDVTSADFTRDYYNNEPIPKVETAFDAYYLYSAASKHIDDLLYRRFDWSWLENHLELDIVGPEYVTEEASFSIPGYVGSINWSTSDSDVATIDDSGKLTAIGNGVVSIIADSYSNGKLFRKEKVITVGFPDIVIKSTYEVGEGYIFTAESTNSDTTLLLNQLVSEGSFHYEWNLLDSSGDMTTQISSNNTFKYMPKENEAITIAVRLVSSSGSKGPIKSVSTNLRVPFNINYNYVIVANNGTTYFIKNNGTYEVGMPSQDFTVTYNFTTYSPNDNVQMGSAMVEKYLKGNDCYILYPVSPWLDRYMTGTKASMTYKWSFPFFDSAMFLDPLEAAISNSGGSERTMHEFDLTICNSIKEKMQKIPFVIIYKPAFPEN